MNDYISYSYYGICVICTCYITIYIISVIYNFATILNIKVFKIKNISSEKDIEKSLPIENDETIKENKESEDDIENQTGDQL